MMQFAVRVSGYAVTLQEKRKHFSGWFSQILSLYTSLLARTDFMGIVADDVGAFWVGASCAFLKLRHAPRYNRLDQSKARGHTHSLTERDRQTDSTLSVRLECNGDKQQSTMFMRARGRLTFAPREKKTLSDMTARRT